MLRTEGTAILIEVLKLEIWEIWDVEIFVDDMFLLSNILEYMQLPG